MDKATYMPSRSIGRIAVFWKPRSAAQKCFRPDHFMSVGFVSVRVSKRLEMFGVATKHLWDAWNPFESTLYLGQSRHKAVLDIGTKDKESSLFSILSLEWLSYALDKVVHYPKFLSKRWRYVLGSPLIRHPIPPAFSGLYWSILVGWMQKLIKRFKCMNAHLIV